MSIKSIEVKVQPDTLEYLTNKPPFAGLCELIWNSLDADATTININYEKGHLSESIKSITIIDNGTSQTREGVTQAFQNFGGSKKRSMVKTETHNRGIHGKYGRGRYIALSLTSSVSFEFVKSGKLNKISLLDAYKTSPKLHDEQESDKSDGCYVTMSPIREGILLSHLFSKEKIDALKQMFCLYYEKNKNFTILLNGEEIDFSDCKKATFECLDELDEIKKIEGFEDVDLKIIEWSDIIKADNKIYFCKDEQIIAEVPLYRTISKPLSAYITGRFIEDSDFEGRLKLSSLDEKFRTFIDEVKVLRLNNKELTEFNQAVNESGGLIKVVRLATQVQDRLKVIEGIREIHHNKILKNLVNERDHLHKVVQEETWLFDEDFALSVSERTLTNALKQYIKTLGRDDLAETIVSDERMDIGLFGKKLPAGRGEDFINLVVELKRPSKIIGLTEINQIESYAMQCSADPRFPEKNYKWDFYLIGGTLDASVEFKLKGNQNHEGNGLIYTTPKTKIYVKTWDELLNQAASKLNYLKTTLEIDYPDTELIGYKHLIQKHKNIKLPEVSTNG